MLNFTIEDLRKTREKARSRSTLREEGYRARINVHLGTCGVGSGAMKILDTVREEVNRQSLKNIEVATSGCAGLCSREPMITAEALGMPPVKYIDLNPEKTRQIIQEHLLGGKVVEKFALGDIPFFKLQVPRVLRNRGAIDPENIEDYIAQDGYEALYKVLTQLTPEQVIEEVRLSGLRGRGGAGFPTAEKWEEGKKYNRFPKYVICNGDEGDPGAFMDRSVLEADPHAVLEGMAICAKVIESHEGYLYVRAEYPLAIKRLNLAIEQAKKLGVLGKNIFGTGFDFDLWVYPGAGAFVCGESTALMYSLEGRRGMPRIKPPRSVEAGLWGQPTVLNNVETFANIPYIVSNGAKSFAAIGTASSKGTKVFALAGRIKNTGLIEVPMGTSLRTILFDIGGGVPEGGEFKAAQTGGPSGGCIPAEYLDKLQEIEILVLPF